MLRTRKQNAPLVQSTEQSRTRRKSDMEYIYCKDKKEFQLLEENLKMRGYTCCKDGAERIREQMGLFFFDEDRANQEGVIVSVFHNLKIYSILRYGA